MIQWHKHFDKIWCIHYLPYKNRYEDIRRELDRVGILNSSVFEWHYTIDNVFNSTLAKIMLQNHMAWSLSPTALCVTFEHYTLIKKAYELGYERIMILENDIRFLKDIDTIEQTIENIPQAADIVLFDYFIHCDQEEFQRYKANLVNEHFARYEKLMSAACYSLTRRAIERLIKSYETFLYTVDIYTSIKTPPGLVKCFALNHIACQYPYQSSANNITDADAVRKAYMKENLDYSKYQMEGFST